MKRDVKARIAAEKQIEAEADQKRRLCRHRAAVEVTNDRLGRVAWWCPDCETQLPPEFDPSQGGITPVLAAITGTPFLPTSVSAAQESFDEWHARTSQKVQEIKEQRLRRENAAASRSSGWTVQQHTDCPPEQKLPLPDIANMTMAEYKAFRDAASYQ